MVHRVSGGPHSQRAARAFDDAVTRAGIHADPHAAFSTQPRLLEWGSTGMETNLAALMILEVKFDLFHTPRVGPLDAMKRGAVLPQTNEDARDRSKERVTKAPPKISPLLLSDVRIHPSGKFTNTQDWHPARALGNIIRRR